MEELTTYIDAYCERLAPGIFAEPVNAMTNFAFMLTAALVLARQETRRYQISVALCVLLFAIGVGSLLFHTFANQLTAIADVTPIAAFVLTYLYAANRYYLYMRKLTAAGAMLLFFPYSALVGWGISAVFPWIGDSIAYVPIALLILGYSVFLRRRLPIVSRDLGIGFILLAVSISFRWFDEPICATVPYGTHFIWHLLNAIMLAWMITALVNHNIRTRSLNMTKSGQPLGSNYGS